MKRFRVAVVGGGHLGQIHAKLLKANPAVELVAVCDPQPLVQQKFIQLQTTKIQTKVKA